MKSEAKYIDLIKSADLSLIEVDLDEKILFANANFCKMFSYSLIELVGKVASYLLEPVLDISNHNLVISRYLGTAADYNKNAIESKKSVELWMKTGAGEDILVSVRNIPVRNELGETTGFIGIHHELTRGGNFCNKTLESTSY